MTSRYDKRTVIATYMMKLATPFKGTFHSRISAASILWKVKCVGLAHSYHNNTTARIMASMATTVARIIT